MEPKDSQDPPKKQFARRDRLIELEKAAQN